jgi:hypothetical protein
MKARNMESNLQCHSCNWIRSSLALEKTAAVTDDDCSVECLSAGGSVNTAAPWRVFSVISPVKTEVLNCKIHNQKSDDRNAK